ncbi:MAG: hypothetical protein HQ478_01035 [Chloroflexi bacterium]|nr:hypothetical protein [Chloroflexota bacterium]
MIYLKSCTRCEGDVQLDWDTYGGFMKCLQCGKAWNYRKPAERNLSQDELEALDREHDAHQIVAEQAELPRAS